MYFSPTRLSKLTYTASGHFALFPELVGIRREAPESDIRFVRVATVVAGRVHTPLGKHVILVVRMFVRILGMPLLTLSAADRLSHLADVLVSRL